MHEADPDAPRTALPLLPLLPTMTAFTPRTWEILLGKREAQASEPVEGAHVPILYLDLDGTVRHGRDELGRFVNGPQDVVVFPEAVELMRRWRDEREGRVVGVSNQGGVALGHMSIRDCIEQMAETHKQTGNLFDRLVFCMHHPEAADPLQARCWCRKPSPGMLIEGARSLAEQYPQELYPPALALMVGDREEDEEAAQLAAVDFMSAATWRGAIVLPTTTTEEHEPDAAI